MLELHEFLKQAQEYGYNEEYVYIIVDLEDKLGKAPWKHIDNVNTAKEVSYAMICTKQLIEDNNRMRVSTIFFKKKIFLTFATKNANQHRFKQIFIAFCIVLFICKQGYRQLLSKY